MWVINGDMVLLTRREATSSVFQASISLFPHGFWCVPVLRLRLIQSHGISSFVFICSPLSNNLSSCSWPWISKPTGLLVEGGVVPTWRWSNKCAGVLHGFKQPADDTCLYKTSLKTRSSQGRELAEQAYLRTQTLSRIWSTLLSSITPNAVLQVYNFGVTFFFCWYCHRPVVLSRILGLCSVSLIHFHQPLTPSRMPDSCASWSGLLLEHVCS